MRKKTQIWLAALMLCSMAFLLGGCTRSSTVYSVAEEQTEEEKTNTIDKTEETVAEGKEFTMSVTCGYGSYIKYGRDMGVQAEITNHGDDFFGELWVLAPNNGSGNQSTLFKKEFSIAAGETKKVEMAIPALFSTGRLKISIRDEAEKEREATSVKVTVQGNTDTMFVGVLSDNYQQLSYFTDAQTRTVLMEAEDFPEEKKSLDMLDIIVINDFNTSILNGDQYEALKDFVRDGGTLVVGTGATGAKTLEVFDDDFLTGTIGEIQKVSLALGSATEVVEKERLDMTLDNGTKVYEENGVTLMEKVAEGKGNIQLFTFDLGLESGRWNTMGKYIVSKVTENVSDAKRSQISAEINDNNFYRMRSCLETSTGDNAPNVGRYVGILVVYLALIGPLLYMVLKKLDKRNYTWVIVPAFAVAFSLIIYMVGTDTRFSRPYVRYITFSHITDGIESEELTFSLTAPYNNDYEVAVPAEYDVTIPVMDYYYGNYDYDKSTDQYDISVGYGAEATTLGIRNHGAFEPAYFSASSMEKAEGTVESAIVTKLDEKGEASYQGTVTNHLGYDLQNAVLIVNNRYYILGDMADGEERTIDGCQFYTVYSTDDIWNSDILSQAVGGDPWSDTSNGDRLRKYYALEYTFTDNAASIDKGNCLLGFTKDSSNPVIDALGLKKEGIKLVTADVSVDYMTDKNQCYIPCLDDRYTVLNGEYDRYYRYINTESFELEVKFGESEKIISVIYPKNGNPENNANGKWYGFYGTINAFNYKTGQYEVLFESGKPAVLTGVEDYLDEENKMRLLLDIDENSRNQYTISLPVLSAVKEAN